MKIIQVVGWYYPDSIGGTEVYVAGLSRALRARGLEVLIATPDSTHCEERTYTYEGIPVYRYPIPSAPTREESQGTVPSRGAELLHIWMAQQRADVIHFHTFGTGMDLHEVRAAKATGARVIVTTHSGSLGYICQRGTMMRWGESLCDGICVPVKCAACELQNRGLPKSIACVLGAIPPRIARIIGSFPGKLGTALSMSSLIARNQMKQQKMLAIVDKFVLLTKWGYEVVRANGALPEKLALNRLGLSQMSAEPKPGPNGRPTEPPITIGYLGRFDSIKGIQDLARAVASLPCDFPIRVEFRGPLKSNPEKAVLKQVAGIVGDDPRVSFAPSVPENEVTEILAGYDVLCCPSICLEGGPTVAIEAQAVGTPVIGTSIGGLSEIVTDGLNGRLVAPGNWRGLSRALREIVNDPAGTVDYWRRNLPTVRTIIDIARDYLLLYTA